MGQDKLLVGLCEFYRLSDSDLNYVASVAVEGEFVQAVSGAILGDLYGLVEDMLSGGLTEQVRDNLAVPWPAKMVVRKQPDDVRSTFTSEVQEFDARVGLDPVHVVDKQVILVVLDDWQGQLGQLVFNG